jgi:superfamily II DNA or RNA helicase
MSKEIRWVLSNNVLTIIKYPPEYLMDIVRLLSFTKKKYDRRKASVKFEFCPCVVYEDINRNISVPRYNSVPSVLPKALTTYAGYRNILLTWAAENGVVAGEEDLTPPVTKDSPYYPRWDLLPKDFEFRYMQREVLRCFAIERGGIIVCTPGFGKTELLGLACSLFPRARILITSYNQSVYTMIGRRIRENVSIAQSYVQRPSTPLRPEVVATARVVVCGTSSLVKVLAVNTDFDFCFIDEAHLACTDKAFASLSVLSQPRIFGLTGSLKRFDGSEFRLKGLAGPVRVCVNVATGIKKGLVTTVEVRWVPVRMQYDILANVKKEVWKHIGIWCNDQRNRLIAAAAKLYGPEEQVLIMCETEQHLRSLQKYLPDYTFLHAGVPMREAYEERFRAGTLKKVASTMMWRQGVDFPNLSILIRADGLSSDISSIQIGGRLIRKTQDKKLAYLYDFHDAWNPVFLKASQTRRNLYKSCAWRQISLSPSSLLLGKFEEEIEQ